jgi:hypothetical protein
MIDTAQLKGQSILVAGQPWGEQTHSGPRAMEVLPIVVSGKIFPSGEFE